ncbi:sentrin-specific protease 7-like isoform X2 [Cyprinodon tularosa]|uniref:sentrin-specific protease 7-like isoform X2 n=1 Tax=Cyprinodon tularosa TaxID=77115 RepID=UPI0018E1E15B|nr:sentrin-specific protease 7-like isoform X2 [Cyprinodon tularosa]
MLTLRQQLQLSQDSQLSQVSLKKASLDLRIICSDKEWRPSRASDRLLRPEDVSELDPPPQKKKSACSGRSWSSNAISVESEDCLAELRAEEHAGSWSPERREDAAPISKSIGSEPEEQPASPCRTSRPPASSPTMKTAASRSRTRRAELRDVMETQRDRWRRFRETRTRPAGPRLRLKSPSQPPSEPIVLSSEEEPDLDLDQNQNQGSGEEGPEPSQSSRTTDRAGRHGKQAPPSFLQLDFSRLHFGLMEAGAGGSMTITENGVLLPLTGSEVAQVTVVASQLRGYGLWDGGVASGGPSPSLLFLWVSEAQANLLLRELAPLQASGADAPSCSFLLLVLKERLQDLQVALLASILDLDQYQQNRCTPCPIPRAQGLLMIRRCPPPLDRRLLLLLGCPAASGQSGGTRSSAGMQLLPSRLIQYPVVPGKGRISVTQEDLDCLEPGEFLNDVIIDFYLRYLVLEGVSGTVAQRTHVFSSFFYKQLSRRRAAGESDAPSVVDRHARHQRVKTWTRHVDIFTKDFLFVPVNQEAHWFLVVVCFPGLEDVRIEEFSGGAERAAGKADLRSQRPPCSLLGCQRRTVTQRPCILVMDSLKLSYHDGVCRLIRDYLQVEWEARRKTPRLFSPDSMKSCSCRVPQQDNSSDCGLYLLQYAECFLQNPVVHFDLPPLLQNWFPRQQVRQKREEIRSLIMRLHRTQLSEQNQNPSSNV